MSKKDRHAATAFDRKVQGTGHNETESETQTHASIQCEARCIFF